MPASAENAPGAPKEPKLTTKAKLKLGAFLAAVSTPILVGGFIGHGKGQDAERAANANDLNVAAQSKRCAALVSHHIAAGGNRVVRLGSLSPQEQTDCGYDFPSWETDSLSNDTAPAGGDVLRVNLSNTVIRLPDAQGMEDRAADYISRSHDFSPWSGVEYATLGAEIGLFVSIAGLAAIGQINRRRQAHSVAEAS